MFTIKLLWLPRLINAIKCSLAVKVLTKIDRFSTVLKRQTVYLNINPVIFLYKQQFSAKLCKRFEKLEVKYEEQVIVAVVVNYRVE